MGSAQAEIRLFARASFSSAAATATDAGLYYLILILGSFGPRLYGPASALGAVGGAITNFLIGRYWAFRATDKPLVYQALQYALASLLTYLAVLGGLALQVEVLHIPEGLAYPPAKAVAWLAVSYPMARFFVFSERRRSGPA